MIPPVSLSHVPSDARRDLILALETSGKEGSVALAEWVKGEGTWRKGSDGSPALQILSKSTLRAEKEHAARLLPKVQQVMEEVGAEPADLGGMVVGSGPGSFTGVRVAASTAKGLAWALGLPLWPFSSLAGAAAAADSEQAAGEEQAADPDQAAGTKQGLDAHHGASRPRLVLFDARGDRVYAAAYRFVQGALETLLAPRATTVQKLLGAQVPSDSLLMGDGAQRHRDLLRSSGWEVASPPAGCPSAIGLLRLLDLDPDTPPVLDRSRWEPDYLRSSGAERTRRARVNRGRP